jgi:catechol 2,3-dioxygenase-like lactoylglutathione lyase family enzyme
VSIYGGPVHQLGIVVEDIDTAMRLWTQGLGIGPFYVGRERSFTNFTYRGNSASPPVLSIALAQVGPLQIELIQQLNDTPSAFTEFTRAGRSGMHHLASMFRDPTQYDAAHRRLTDAGLVEVQSGIGSGGRWSYLGTDPLEFPMFELCETHGALGEMFDRVRAAAIGWDGADPIRESTWSGPVEVPD